MLYSQIIARVGEVPYISQENARYLYNLVVRERLTSILELGIGHGTATCIIAAALQEIGRGKVTAVDLIEAEEWFKPSAEEQVVSAGLSDYVDIIRMKTGYNWFLHDKIRDQTKDVVCYPLYDLCIVDGPKNWTIDSAAFFCVDKLLRPGGWIIFDDYSWTYAEADKYQDATDGISHRSLSENERLTPHIREVFELLVVQHEDYSNFIRFSSSPWAIAQKIKRDTKTYTMVHRESYANIVAKLFHKARLCITRV
jgi:predicted O-methyltransferase YrrM